MFFNAAKSRKSKNKNNQRAGKISTHVVPTKRWVHRNQLELGMYVNELDKPWEETRFLFQGFLIDNYETLRDVQNACEYANVQTEKLAQVSSNSTHRLVGATRK